MGEITKLASLLKLIVFLALNFLLIVFLESSEGNARMGPPTIVNKPISQEKFEQFRYLIENFDPPVKKEKILYYEDRNISVLRINDKNYCRERICITFVVVNCGKKICPYGSALAGRFMNHPDAFFGDLIANGSGPFFFDQIENEDHFVKFIVHRGFVTIGCMNYSPDEKRQPSPRPKKYKRPTTEMPDFKKILGPKK
ncbi:MAG: hypothetical protein QGF16_09355 [Rhodospirillales bacterium]|nr:hypothetical protein [Rhodospirillales bacterium]